MICAANLTPVTAQAFGDAPAPGSLAPTATAAIPDAAGALILVIDDDAGLCMLVERYLTMFGYRPLIASDGEAGLRIARSHPEIELVMLDAVMAGISGQELANELKLVVPDAQVLFCSGHPASALTRLGIDLTTAQFMQKPCRPADLKQRLSEILVAR
jgi:DNA-binding response OmpR family regulator